MSHLLIFAFIVAGSIVHAQEYPGGQLDSFAMSYGAGLALFFHWAILKCLGQGGESTYRARGKDTAGKPGKAHDARTAHGDLAKRQR